jgi:AcrR family transcriptional regulator
VGPVGTEPALRADALRNRRRILDAAAEAFAEGGLDVGVAEIARRAGVGAGTIFRRFASKDDLVIAIVEERISQLLELAERSLEDEDAAAGFRAFVLGGIEMQIRDRGFFDSAARRIAFDPRLHEARDRMFEASGKVLARAQQAGAVRGDLVAEDVPVLLCAVAGTPPPLLAAHPEIWRRYADIVLDGLKPEGASELGHEPPDLDKADAVCAEGAASSAALRRA